LRHPAPALPGRDRPVPPRAGSGARRGLRLRALLALLRHHSARSHAGGAGPQSAPDRDGAHGGGAARAPQRALRGGRRPAFPRRRSLRRRLHAGHRPSHPGRYREAAARAARQGAARGGPAPRQGCGQPPRVEAVVHPRAGSRHGPAHAGALLARGGADRPPRGSGLPCPSPSDGGLPPVPAHPLYRRAAAVISTLLRAEAMTAGYGKMAILHGVSLIIAPGELVAVIGPNGAGKSTAFKVIVGFLKPTEGRVLFDGDDITGLRPDQVLRRGLAYVPQGRIVFPQMTVLENLEMGGYTERDPRRVAAALDQVYRLFPILAERRYQKAGTMSGGEQQMVAIGRALMTIPKLVL